MILQVIPDEFFTPESILTLAGATTMTTVITNVCQHVFNWNPKWFSLFVAKAYLAEVGITYEIKPWLGVRVDTRYIGIGDVTKPGTTTMAGSIQNIQSTAGLVFWF